MKIEYTIFDNDGTLYSPDADLKGAVTGRMISFLKQKLRLPENVVAEERKRLIKKYGIESTEFVFGKEYDIDYDEFVSETYLSVPVEKYGIVYNSKLRRILQHIDVPKAVLTNNPSEFARKILKLLKVEEFFEYIIGSREMCYKLKPNKEAFLRTIDITGSDPRTTIFVDDIPEFHLPAKELGMTTVLVGSKNNQIKREYIDYEIEKIYDIEQILKGGQSV